MPKTGDHYRALDSSRRLVPWLACSLGCLAALFADLGRAAEEITTFAQFGAVPGGRAFAGRPVRYRGIVVCYDAGWGQLYVHDGSATGWFNPRDFSVEPGVGQSVEITATTTLIDGAKALTNLSLTILGAGTLPPAKRLSLGELAGDLGQWIEVTGRVRVVDTSWGRLALVIHENGTSCQVMVMAVLGTNNFENLLGVTVRARGINATTISPGRVEAAKVFAPGMDQLAVIQPAGTNQNSLEVLPIGGLLDRKLGDWTNQAVRINGLVVSSQPGKSIIVKDPTGVLRAEVMQLTQTRAEDRVDVRGYLRLTAEGPVLGDAWFEMVRAPQRDLAAVPGPGSVRPAALPELITRASDIRKLRPDEAAWHVPVRLRGVITFADPEWGNVFLQDQSGGVFVQLQEKNVRTGQWVELVGQTGPGGFAPEIVNAAVQVLGITNLPAPARVDLADLADGHFDSHWVEMEGVVRRVSLDVGHLNLSLMTPRGKFTAIVPGFYKQAMPTNLLDARVQVRGACASDLNGLGQLIGIRLQVPALDQIAILEPAPADAFAVASTPIAAVARFDPDYLAGRRIKVHGVVTALIPGQGFFVQDGSGGLSVHTQPTNPLVGDAVDVLGFPALGDFSPVLEEATFQSTGKARLPQPLATTAEQILLHGTNDGQMVSLEARLLQSVVRAASPQLILQSGSIIFTARNPAPAAGAELPALASGSVVRLTGVCSIHGGERNQPESFRLLLRSPADLVLLFAPSWWTALRILWVFGGLGLVLAVALAWVGALRRQVRLQTRTLRAEIAERERMEILIAKTHQELLTVSRQAGMAEIATNVLHNVGNVLNSVNISAGLIVESVKQFRVSSLARVVVLLREHAHDLGAFITVDPRGKHVPAHLAQLSDHLLADQAAIVHELDSLQENVAHIKEIVAMQQSFATFGGVKEMINVVTLVEDSMRMNEGALSRHNVELIRDFEAVPPLNLEKHKILQILVNLLRNAKHACQDSDRTDKRLTVRVTNGDDRVRISVIDNGIGIPPENLIRIFSHGFTTRKDGHGFGLHSGALAAREMGGSLTAHSDGPGQGAVFTLELPCPPLAETHE